MRQVHRAGEKCFVDYAGPKPSYVNPKTGERVEVELFVAVMGASNYTYAEATASQKSRDWITSHIRLVEFLGGVPEVFVPDQLKSGVVIASRCEPTIHRTYEEWSQHYATAILPARPAHPRDKAKVEVGVLVAERWILARLRSLTRTGPNDRRARRSVRSPGRRLRWSWWLVACHRGGHLAGQARLPAGHRRLAARSSAGATQGTAGRDQARLAMRDRRRVQPRRGHGDQAAPPPPGRRAALLDPRPGRPHAHLVALRAAGDERVRAEPFDAIELRVGVLLGDDPEER